jgi:transposase-like protein
VLTEVGPLQVCLPQDRESISEPTIIAKRQRRLTGVGDTVITLSAKG